MSRTKKYLFVTLIICFSSILLVSGCTKGESPTPSIDEKGEPDVKQNNYKEYYSPEGWSFHYPIDWDRVEEGFVQDTNTGKTVTFHSLITTQSDLEEWIESEIDRKVGSLDEADNELVEPFSVDAKDNLTIYRYAIKSIMGDGPTALLRSVIFFDGSRRYEFYSAIPPVTEEEFELVINSFKPIK